MRTDLFDFALPEDRIALRPVAPRDAARLLVVRPQAAGELDDRSMRDLPALLCRGDALVVNDTKVLPAALHGRRIGRGDMPLPPYIASRRAVDDQDRTDYQTMFARIEGSVAAPTAGLHFTEDLTEALRQAGIALHRVTLHVGLGTFLPVKVEDTEGH